MERSSPPVVSAASLTTLHQVLSCFLEPCSQGTSPVGAAKVYWHQIVDTLALIMGEPALDFLKPHRGTGWDERRSRSRSTYAGCDARRCPHPDAA
jgi:hypothetical protein